MRHLAATSWTRLRRLLVGGGCLMGCVLLAGLRLECVQVSGDSMQPTFQTGDILLLDKRAYRERDPARGDLVVARYRQELVVKRVAALPHEEVEVKAGRVYIDRRPLAEDHPIEPGLLEILPGRLFDGRFALLGDNRAMAPDETVHPIVTRDQIVGKVLLRLWSSGRASRSG